MKIDLLEYKKNIFSQNGEDGVIEKIFDIIGVKNKICCEFGAWDGVRFCNVRNLIINKCWKGILIEANEERCSKIKDNYSDSDIFIINSYVDSEKNKLSFLIKNNTDLKDIDIDFLSIDIDGLDYEIFESLDFYPNVICIEVNAGHNPNDIIKIKKNIAKKNIGQSLKIFSTIAEKKGYSLVAYTGNAFYIKNELLSDKKLKKISEEEAYSNFLSKLSEKEKEWLYLVNLGKVPPYYKYKNSFLTKDCLRFDNEQIKRIYVEYKNNFRSLRKSILNFLKK